MKPEDVKAAAANASVIVHAVNPPAYRGWETLVLPMLESTIAAARTSGARIVLPGNVYNYGPEALPLVGEEAPQRPRTVKGEIRAEMERRLRASGQRVLVVRSGDYFGARSSGNWFGAMVRPGRPVHTVMSPGTRGVGHAWAYLPDVAETMLRLLEREADLGTFASFHMDGHWDEDGTTMAETIRRVGGGRKVRAFPWALTALASPFVPLLRELRPMRYLWQSALRLDNARLVSLLGAEPRTPLDAAVRETLRGLGCLDEHRAAA
jgi:nucleoside-diphosphate-sugar epimerase